MLSQVMRRENIEELTGVMAHRLEEAGWVGSRFSSTVNF
jgi:hypothetical protein